MIITIASGKGGTGKTLIATGLAWVISTQERKEVYFLDCDVEEPNANLFMHAEFDKSDEVTIPTPEIQTDKCDLCGHCAAICTYHALAMLKLQVKVFPRLCHGCGLCTSQCHTQAISEKSRRLGIVQQGQAKGNIIFSQGISDIGEAYVIPVIKKLKDKILSSLPPKSLAIIDSPPGTACQLVETLRGSDYTVLVTEPTPFGLHDLALAVEVTRNLHIPLGVAINRDGIGDCGVEEYCHKEDIPIILHIPFDRKIAQTYINGDLWVEKLPEYQRFMTQLYDSILQGRENNS